MALLQTILDFISNNLMAVATSVAFVLEFLMRIIKTEKPKSILLMIAGFLALVGSIFSKLAEFLNKIIPQNLK